MWHCCHASAVRCCISALEGQSAEELALLLKLLMPLLVGNVAVVAVVAVAVVAVAVVAVVVAVVVAAVVNVICN